jgi:hypothetical protein
MGHYHCFTVYIPETKSKQISDTFIVVLDECLHAYRHLNRTLHFSRTRPCQCPLTPHTCHSFCTSERQSRCNTKTTVGNLHLLSFATSEGGHPTGTARSFASDPNANCTTTRRASPATFTTLCPSHKLLVQMRHFRGWPTTLHPKLIPPKSPRLSTQASEEGNKPRQRSKLNKLRTTKAPQHQQFQPQHPSNIRMAPDPKKLPLEPFFRRHEPANSQSQLAIYSHR